MRLVKDADKAELELRDDYALLIADDVWVYGKYFDFDSKIDFDHIIDHHTKGALKNLQPVPSKLAAVLDRAIIATDKNADYSQVRVEGGKLRVFSKSGRMEVSDFITLKEHPEIPVKRYEPRLIRAGIGAYEEFCLTDSCLIMHGKEAGFYLVAGRSASA
jgi:hypothetical protein